MKQNKNGRCFLFRFFSKQTMKHGDLLNDLPNPCNCETSLLSRTTHFTSKLISFSNFFLHRRSGYKDFYFEILVVQRWHILLLNFSDYFFFLRLRSQTGSPRFADSKLEPARALDPRRWPKGSKLWERECQTLFIREFISTDVCERRKSNGSGLFAILSHDFEQIFWQIVSVKVSLLSNTDLVSSRHLKREKSLSSGWRASLENVAA